VRLDVSARHKSPTFHPCLLPGPPTMAILQKKGVSHSNLGGSRATGLSRYNGGAWSTKSPHPLDAAWSTGHAQLSVLP
jgi:hypothetical protein